MRIAGVPRPNEAERSVRVKVQKLHLESELLCNRALYHIKMKQWKPAEMDTNLCLCSQHCLRNHVFVKISCRRAVAYKQASGLLDRDQARVKSLGRGQVTQAWCMKLGRAGQTWRKHRGP